MPPKPGDSPARPKVAVFGASGFLGSTLCERMYFQGSHDFAAIVHSTGNATRLARLPVDIRVVNLLDRQKTLEALKGCSAVVNCTRGGDAVMLQGLANLIWASQKAGIAKFIHIGSMAIYGADPKPDSATEAGVPDPNGNAYGILKLRQDGMVFDMNRRGLPSLVLCPSNISGPYSYFVLGAASGLLQNRVALVDGGANPTNLVHVENLVAAILAAVDGDKGWGERFFVNDAEKTTWKGFFTDLARMMGLGTAWEEYTRDQILGANRTNGHRGSFLDNFKIVFSGEFRNSLSVFPAVKKANQALYDYFQGRSPAFQDKVRKLLERPVHVAKEASGRNLKDPLLQVQVRTVYHSPEKAAKVLGYRQFLDYPRGMETTAAWLKFAGLA